MPIAETAYIAVGSNLGDRWAYLHAGVTATANISQIQLEAVSNVYESPPLDLSPQPAYLNAVFSIRSQMPPRELLQALLNIENAHQRRRQGHWSPRTLDLDLLMFGDLCLQESDLVVPHPDMCQRCFVLVPLNELAPELIHPVTRKTINSLLNSLHCTERLQSVGPLMPFQRDPHMTDTIRKHRYKQISVRD